MKIRQVIVLTTSMLLLASTYSVRAELEGFFPSEGGPITVQPTAGPIEVGGIEFVAEPGFLTQGESPAPFAFFIPNSAAPGNVTFGTLGTPVTVSGAVTLDVIASADAVISASWGKGVVPVPFPVTGGGGGFGLKGSFPYDGGALTIEPRFTGTPYTATELSLEATEGTLTGGGSASPFQSLTENTAQKWSANSSAGVTIDGPVALDVLASAGASISGLASDGTESVDVNISRNDPPLTEALTGSYASGGGAITIESTNGPVATRGLDLSVIGGGGLRGIGDSSPAPYDTLHPDNSIDRWRASSATDVIIDGRVRLDLEASSGANVKAIMTDGTSSNLFNVTQRPRISVSGSYPHGGGPVTVTARRTAELFGIELNAVTGTLTGGGSAAPFESLDTNETSQWSVSSTVPVTLDGNVTLDVVASDGAEISGYFDDGYDANLFNVVAQTPPRTSSLRGSYPVSGGPLTIASTFGPFVSRGLDISSGTDSLTGGGSPAPFETLETNTSSKWSVRSSTDVTIDGSVTLDLSIAAGEQTMLGVSTSSVSSQEFLITPTFSNDGGGLQGTFPTEGGPITVSPIAGPIGTAGIEIIAAQGTLTQGSSAAPFQFFLPTQDNPNTVVWGNLGSTVIIDGPVTLDATASADAVLEGSWGDGPTPVSMTFSQGGGVIDPGTGGGGIEVSDNPPLTQESIDLAIDDLDASVLESELLVLFPEGGGPLTLMGTNGPVETLGVEFIVDEGTIFQGDSPAPFQFFLGDEPGRVVLGSLGIPVVIDEPITLDIFASADAQLSGAWGEGALATFSAFAVPNVPEPNAGLMASLGLFGLLALRRRNR